jgi:hypothetical protein
MYPDIAMFAMLRVPLLFHRVIDLMQCLWCHDKIIGGQKSLVALAASRIRFENGETSGSRSTKKHPTHFEL